MSPWLLTWLANYKRASGSGARPVLLKFHSQNSFEVRRRYSCRWLSRWAAKFSHRYFFRAWRTFRKNCWSLGKWWKIQWRVRGNFISIYKISRTLHGRFGIRILSSSAESISHEWAKRTSKRYFQYEYIIYNLFFNLNVSWALRLGFFIWYPMYIFYLFSYFLFIIFTNTRLATYAEQLKVFSVLIKKYCYHLF